MAVRNHVVATLVSLGVWPVACANLRKVVPTQTDALGVHHRVEVQLRCLPELLVDDERYCVVGVIDEGERSCCARSDVQPVDNHIRGSEAKATASPDSRVERS